MAEAKNKKRLTSELKQLTTTPPPGVKVEEDSSNPN